MSGEYSEKKVAEKVEYEGMSEEEKGTEEFYQDGIRPAMFKMLVGKGHPEFSGNKQQDAMEYFHYLLERFMVLITNN